MKFSFGSIVAAWLWGLFCGMIFICAVGGVGTFYDKQERLGASYNGRLYSCTPLMPDKE